MIKPVVLVDERALAGEERLFSDGAISALLRLRDRTRLCLIEAGSAARRKERLSVLAGESIVPERFDSTAEDALSEVADSVSAEQSEVYLVAARSGDVDSGAVPDGLQVLSLEESGWAAVARRILFPTRTASVQRVTAETRIAVRVNLDGRGASEISTGIGFFDHMLDQLARHSGVDLTVDVEGDLHVDEHHTIEDTAIAIGEAFGRAIGDKRGVERYAFVLPMDDSLAQVAFDWSGRSWLVWNAEFRREKIGDMPTEMFYHFFKSFSDAARCNINISVGGDNEHHMIESVFKALGRCIRLASTRREDDDRVPSTKGTL